MENEKLTFESAIARLEEIVRSLESGFHALVVPTLVHLRPQGVYRRALAGVQHAHLNVVFIGCDAHLAAHGVDLPHKVALGGAAYRGVARHQRNGIEILAEAEHGKAHTGAGERGLAASVPRAYHNYIIAFIRAVHDIELYHSGTDLYRAEQRDDLYLIMYNNVDISAEKC